MGQKRHSRLILAKCPLSGVKRPLNERLAGTKKPGLAPGFRFPGSGVALCTVPTARRRVAQASTDSRTLRDAADLNLRSHPKRLSSQPRCGESHGGHHNPLKSTLPAQTSVIHRFCQATVSRTYDKTRSASQPWALPRLLFRLHPESIETRHFERQPRQCH